MKKMIIIFLIILIFSPISTYGLANSCNNCLVMDMDSGRILYENNKDKKMLIASTTKIMTAVIAIENKNLNSMVTIGDEVLPMYGTNIYIEPEEEISLRDLLYGLLLRSGNDASVSIAKFVSGNVDDFVYLMNKKAIELGMNNTIFKNPHGLDEDTQNYSTPYDMALLMKYAYSLQDFVEISGTKKWTVKTNKKSYVWYNRNKLLFNYKYLTGGKTGYTPSSGKSLVSTASKNNLNLIFVTLNNSNHYEVQKEIYEYLFNKYKKTLLIDKNNITFNNSKYDNLYINYSFSYPLARDEEKDIKVIVDYYNIDKVNNNSIVGEIYVLFKNREIFRENIYIKKEECKRNSIISKVISFFNSLF